MAGRVDRSDRTGGAYRVPVALRKEAMATDVVLELIEITEELRKFYPVDPANPPDLSGIIQRLQMVTRVLELALPPPEKCA